MNSYLLGYFLVLATITAGFVLTTIYFRRIYTWPSRLRTWLLGICRGGFAVLFAFLAAELVVKYAFMETETTPFTLAPRDWFDRYWKPINRYGYRDPEYDLEGLRHKKRLFVIGDSYVMGFGIRNPEDRLGNLVGRGLGTEWAVMNMARLGWDTGSELEALRSFPLTPDAIVLVYVYNDFEGAAHRLGLMTDDDLFQPSALTRAIIGRSYLLNLAYFRLYWRITKERESLHAYDRFVTRSFLDSDVRRLHEAELQKLIDHTKEIGVPLLVTVFPDFHDLEGSREVLSPVIDLLKSRGVPVVDLAPVFRGRPMRDLAVNALDHHPSTAVHREVAALVLARMRALGMTGEGSAGRGSGSGG